MSKRDELKTEFINLVWKIERSGKEDLLKWLDKTGFYDTPASTRFHLASEGGLLEHSLNVYRIAWDINYSLGSPISDDSLLVCSLFHDLGKHEAFNKKYYSENRLKSGKLGVTPYKKNKDLISVPHEILSLQILGQFIELSENEYFAILHHNGMYGDLKYQLSGNETQLQMILHFADLYCSRAIE